MNTEERINQEKARLYDIFSALDENERQVASGLVDQASFMLITLEELQKSICEKGSVDEYKNGKDQYGTKLSAELQAYNQTVRSYSAIVSKLLKIVPLKPVKVESTQEKWMRINAEKEAQRLAFVERIKARTKEKDGENSEEEL